MKINEKYNSTNNKEWSDLQISGGAHPPVVVMLKKERKIKFEKNTRVSFFLS